jgi:chromate transporter
MKNPWVKAAMSGLKPGVIGVILATGISLIYSNIVPATIEWKALIITTIIAALKIGSQRIRKKKIAPIPLIGISALLGILIGFVM